jgi:hypothetical protein
MGHGQKNLPRANLVRSAFESSRNRGEAALTLSATSRHSPRRNYLGGRTITQKRRGLRDPSAVDHKTQSDVAQLTRERDEALEREKAASEVLRVISS